MILSRRRLILGAAGTAVVGACGPSLAPFYEAPVGDVILTDPLPAAGWEGSEDDVAANIGDPIILTASLTLQPGATGSPNLGSLTNPYGLPMELLEVRFSVAPVSTSTSFNTVAGLGIGVKADLGTIAVIDSDCPVSLLGTYRDAGNPSYATNNDGVSVWLPTSSSTQANAVNSYGWRLKYPLYMPGKATLNVNFHHLATVPVPIKIWVSYHCRMRPKGYKPARLMVPWVCNYSSKAFQVTNNAAADSDSSSELDLVNPFSVPLEVVRLAGGYASVTLNPTAVNSSSEIINLAQTGQYTFVQMATAQGDEVVFSQTPFEALFPAAWRTWDLPDGITFSPGEWLKVALTRTALDYDPSAATLQGTSNYAVTLTGYREVGASEFSQGF